MVCPAPKAKGTTQLKGFSKTRKPPNPQHKSVHIQDSLDDLKIYHQNIRGLKGKLDQLTNFLYSDPPHIVCLTEHYLKDQEIDLTVFEHYKLSAKFCRKQHKNGGSCIFVHENINFNTIPTDHVYKEKDFEICAIKLDLCKMNIVIIVVYRSPSGDYNYFLSKLELFLKSLCTTKTKLIICGDINVDYLYNHSRKQQLDMLMANYNLTSVVNFPTRTIYGSGTAIDNFFIDISQNYSIKPLINGLSDHDAQLLILENIIGPAQKHTSSYIRNYNDYSIQEFLLRLSMESWEDVFTENNLNNIFNKFLDTYLKIFNTCFTKKKLHSTHAYNPWITRGIKISCQNKRILYLNCRNKIDKNLKNQYKNYCKILSNVIKAAKKMHNDELILKSKNRIKTTWGIIKKETGDKNHHDTINLLKVNDTMLNNSQEIACAFNDYFSSAADTIINNIRQGNDENKDNISHTCYLKNNFNNTFPNISWKHASTHEINKIIESLKTKNSCGYDEIPIKILKLSTPYILSPLTFLCNKSLSTGIFPERLKYAQIRPIYKKGDRQLITNYRPISLLTSFSKIFEKLILTRLLRHLDANEILAKEQYGFRCNSSTENAAYEIFNEITKSMNKKCFVGGLFCDLEKAFDCVNHKILLEKLKFYGITGKLLDLIQSFLHGRFQNILIADASSGWRTIQHGVPQGSILGPLLFLIYINDLPLLAGINSKIVLFADDTSTIITCSNREDLTTALYKTLSNINLWFKANFLSLNINKTCLLQFRTNNKIDNTLELKYLNETILNVSSVKFLGLLVDDTLSWGQHINQLASKLSSACYAIRTLTPLLSKNAIRMLYFSYAHSIISYGIIFWGNSSNSIKIFKQQKKILRIMTNSKKIESCRKLFKKMKILPFYCQYILSLSMYMVNNKHLFTKNLEIHSHSTRMASNFHVPTAKLTKYQKGAHYMGIKIFNHLPGYIKGLINEKQIFKNTLEKFLLDNIFYSINEYLNHSIDDFNNHSN